MRNSNKKITINDLASMVKRGFDETGGKIGEIKNEISGVKNEVTGVKKELKSLSESNAREHEAILLRLDNVAYRFELVELQKRVEILEKRAGVKHK